MLLIWLGTTVPVDAWQETPNSKVVRPNIVWICADDFSPDMSCLGTQGVATPNLDGLLKQSTYFSQAFCTAPVCSASRSAFVTGVFQTTLGAHAHRTRIKPSLPPDQPTVMQLLQEAGYYVSNQGKTDYNFTSTFKFDGNDWRGRTKDQPFFAQFQIYQPHRPFEKNRDPSRAAKLSIPPQYPDHPVTRADWANYLESVEKMDQKVGAILQRLDDEGLRGNTIVFFFGDHGRPHMWAKQWLYDGGIKIPLMISVPDKPDGECRELASLLDLAPTTLQLAGVDVPRYMQGVDLFGNQLAARKYVFAARDRSGDAIERIRSVRTKRYKYIRNFTWDRPYLGSSSYKRIHYPLTVLLPELHRQNQLTDAQARFLAKTKPKEELYDVQRDPFELENLADKPELEAVRNELAAALEQWQQDTKDLGALPEMPDAQLNALIASKKSWYQKEMKKRKLSNDPTDQQLLQWWEKKLGLGHSHSDNQ